MEVVDTETAKEFMKETLAAVDVAELGVICTDVEAKSTEFQTVLAVDALPELSADALAGVTKRIFSTRGKPRKQLAEIDIALMRERIAALLDGAGEPGDRLQAFVDQFPDFDENVRVDFASELMHFARPDRHWLWTRWMWDPRTKTGSLPLVTSAAYSFEGETAGEVYTKVGRAVAFVHEVGEAVGFREINRSLFGTDVYLGCVYVVYAYTVLKMRMTNEFNKVMPGLPEFCRRILGVHRRSS